MKAFKYLLIVVFLYQFGNVYAQDTLRIKVMTYNIRFGELASLEELASHIKSFNPDFVALQEIKPIEERELRIKSGVTIFRNWHILQRCLACMGKQSIIRVDIMV